MNFFSSSGHISSKNLRFEGSSDLDASSKNFLKEIQTLLNKRSLSQQDKIELLSRYRNFEKALDLLLVQQHPNFMLLSVDQRQSHKNTLLQKLLGTQSVDSFIKLILDKTKTIQSAGEICKLLGSNHVKLVDIILNPDELSTFVGEGGISFERRGSDFDRMSLLFALLQSKGIQPKDCHSFEGKLKDNQMRSTSYVMLQLPKIQKTVFVCNDYGEASYIVHDMMSTQDIPGLSKRILQQSPQVVRIKFYQSDITARTRQVEYELFGRDKNQIIKNISNSIGMVLENKILSKTESKNDDKVRIQSGQTEVIYKGELCYVVSKSGIPKKYIGSTPKIVSDFKQRAKGRNGFYPSRGIKQSIATVVLRKQFVEEKKLKSRDEISATILQLGQTQVIHRGQKCYVIDHHKFKEYIGIQNSKFDAFRKRSDGKEGYYPQEGRYKKQGIFVTLATIKHWESFVSENGLKKRNEASYVQLSLGQAEVVYQKQRCYVASINGKLAEYVGNGNDMRKSLIEWAQGKIGFFDNKGRVGNGLFVDLIVCDLREQFVIQEKLIKVNAVIELEDGQKEIIIGGNKLYAISQNTKPSEYIGDAYDHRISFQMYANGKDGYFPKMGKSGPNKYIDLATADLREQFVKEGGLKKRQSL